jgi:DNA-binding CsgD family transcriptional regulator
MLHLIGKTTDAMIRRKKNYFFIRYFYRWKTIALCAAMGSVTLWFYFQALTDICRYPLWFPISLYVVNLLLLTVSTYFIHKPGTPQTKMRIHYVNMFILLIINPAAVIALSEIFMSILWTLSIATYLLYCLLFIRYKRIDRLITGIPFATYLLHILYWFLVDKPPGDIGFHALFAFLMSLFYGLFYWFFEFCLDNTQEILSVYLDNKDINEFLKAYRLTPREREICACIINGYSAKKSGDKLYISEGTVKNHIKKIYKKMGIKGRMELMHLIWDFTLLKNS